MTKIFVCRFFFGLVRLFSQIFFVSKEFPFIFSYFAKEWMFKTSQRPPFTFSALRYLPETKNSEKKISKEKFQKEFGFFFQFFSHAGTVEEKT